MNRTVRLFWFIFGIFLFFVGDLHAQKWDILSADEKATLHGILAHWEGWMPAQKKSGTAPLMTFKKLYQGLSPKERAFLDRVRAINPKKSFGFQGDHLGIVFEGVEFKRIDGHEPQYLPENVYEAYERMMKAMERDLGKRLLVESGFRSPAYQLYTFLYYLPKHNYSLVETGHWIALPGYSEHGAPFQQAIDFINQEGINGEDNPEDFERLPEYEWLQAHAKEFGFELSYPRGKKGITFEPWHWRYVKRS